MYVSVYQVKPSSLCSNLDNTNSYMQANNHDNPKNWYDYRYPVVLVEQQIDFINFLKFVSVKIF